jgi:hypothetical protein
MSVGQKPPLAVKPVKEPPKEKEP